MDEKSGFYGGSGVPSPAPAPPPAYAAAPSLGTVTAIYDYNGADPGDVALQINDRLTVLEYSNADWWKGRNERTGQEGIFPRSYVKLVDEKAVPPPGTSGTNYGNVPLEVSQGGAGPVEPGKPSKINEQGKKFGKKLGNATIFGAVSHVRLDLSYDSTADIFILGRDDGLEPCQRHLLGAAFCFTAFLPGGHGGVSLAFC